jgi:hypothetical protein
MVINGYYDASILISASTMVMFVHQIIEPSARRLVFSMFFSSRVWTFARQLKIIIIDCYCVAICLSLQGRHRKTAFVFEQEKHGKTWKN